MQKDDERGVALILALFVVTLLVALILEFDVEARREYREAAAFRDNFKASILTRHAVKAAGILLRQDALKDKQTGEKFDALTDLWAMPIKNFAVGDGLLNAQITDERGKFNLNDLRATANDPIKFKATTDRARRLFELLQLNPDLVDTLIDWTDQDDNPRPAGAESTYYQSQRPAYRAANDRLQSVADLRLIKGFTPEIIDRLSRYVTVHPLDGSAPINLNTADILVIQSLDADITTAMASEIVQGRPYKTKVDLDRISSFKDIGARLRSDYDIRSDFYSGRLAITVNESNKAALAVLHRDADKGDSTVEYLRVF
jgi:general secretion pathway protein K